MLSSFLQEDISDKVKSQQVRQEVRSTYRTRTKPQTTPCFKKDLQIDLGDLDILPLARCVFSYAGTPSKFLHHTMKHPLLLQDTSAATLCTVDVEISPPMFSNAGTPNVNGKRTPTTEWADCGGSEYFVPVNEYCCTSVQIRVVVTISISWERSTAAVLIRRISRLLYVLV